MKNFLFIILIVQFACIQAQDKTVIYDLKIMGNVAGSLTATKKVVGNQIIYTVDSESSIHLFGTTTVKTHQEATYINKQLINSLNEVWKDGKIYDETKVEKSGAGYVITRNGTSSNLDQPISYSSVRLYFYEPDSVKEVFSEVEGIFKSISASGTNVFQLTDPGKHTNTYTYENDILHQAVIDHQYANITLQIRP